MKTPKRSGLVFTALLSLSLLFPAACGAVEKTKNSAGRKLNIGFADLSILLAFHPLMQYYSIDNRVFLKPFKKGLTKRELLKEAAGRHEKYRASLETGAGELNLLRKELDSIEAEISRLRVEMSRGQDAVNRNYTAEYAALQSETERAAMTRKYHKALADVDAGYYGAKKKYDEKKNAVSLRMAELSRSSREVDYLDGKAERELLNEIASEVNEALKEAAEEAGIGVVLNSAAVSQFTPPEDLRNENYMAEDTNLKKSGAAEINYGDIFETTDGTGSGKKAGAAVEDCKAVFAGRGAFVESFMRKGVSINSNRLFAHAGENLTLKAVEKILIKYLVPRARIDKIIKIIKMMSDDFEHIYDTEEKLPVPGR